MYASVTRWTAVILLYSEKEITTANLSDCNETTKSVTASVSALISRPLSIPALINLQQPIISELPGPVLIQENPLIAHAVG